MHFTYKNLKYAPNEQLEVGLDDYAPHIYISTFPSQAAFAKAYESKIKDKVKVTPQVQKLADEITKDIKLAKDGEVKDAKQAEKDFKQQQARAIYNWVSRNIRYVAIYLDDGSITPHDANSIIDNRYGDCKDHNALLIALLSAKGISASSAMINSGMASGSAGRSFLWFPGDRNATVSRTQKTLTIVIKFDEKGLVRDFAYNTSKF